MGLVQKGRIAYWAVFAGPCLPHVTEFALRTRRAAPLAAGREASRRAGTTLLARRGGWVLANLTHVASHCSRIRLVLTKLYPAACGWGINGFRGDWGKQLSSQTSGSRTGSHWRTFAACLALLILVRACDAGGWGGLSEITRGRGRCGQQVNSTHHWRRRRTFRSSLKSIGQHCRDGTGGRSSERGPWKRIRPAGNSCVACTRRFRRSKMFLRREEAEVRGRQKRGRESGYCCCASRTAGACLTASVARAVSICA